MGPKLNTNSIQLGLGEANGPPAHVAKNLSSKKNIAARENRLGQRAKWTQTGARVEGQSPMQILRAVWGVCVMGCAPAGRRDVRARAGDEPGRQGPPMTLSQPPSHQMAIDANFSILQKNIFSKKYPTRIGHISSWLGPLELKLHQSIDLDEFCRSLHSQALAWPVQKVRVRISPLQAKKLF